MLNKNTCSRCECEQYRRAVRNRAFDIAHMPTVDMVIKAFCEVKEDSLLCRSICEQLKERQSSAYNDLLRARQSRQCAWYYGKPRDAWLIDKQVDQEELNYNKVDAFCDACLDLIERMLEEDFKRRYERDEARRLT